jgi:peptidoglycan/LPS O-acetylase OafA/YrhL
LCWLLSREGSRLFDKAIDFNSVGNVATQTNLRLLEMDAVRGWAALSVIVFHVFWEALGVVEPNFRNSWTAPFINGSADVAIFFVLSGDVIVYKYLATGNSTIVQSIALRRYLRLSLPIFVSSMMIFVLLKSGLYSWDSASALLHRENWFRITSADKATLATVFTYSFADVYWWTPTEPQYMPFLWTMQTELFGSAAVILYALAQRPIAFKKTCCAAIAVCLLSEWAMCGDHRGTRWSTTVGVLVVTGIINNRPLCAVLARSRVSRFLGHIAFPLYLVQLPMILGPMSWMVIWAAQHGFETSADHLGIAVATITLCVLCAWGFSPVERGTAVINRFIVAAVGSVIDGPRSRRHRSLRQAETG